MQRSSPAIALTMAVIIALGACGGESEPPATPTTSSTSLTTTAAPTTTSAPATTSSLPVTSVTEATTTTTRAGDDRLEFEIDISDGEVDGPGKIAVALGTRVTLIVTADVEDEVHLHSYDVFADVGPSSAAVIEFEANVPGIFEVELEDAGLEILEVEVS